MTMGGRLQKPKVRRKPYREAPSTCPTPHKLAFSCEKSAESALRYSHHDGRTVKPARVYLCECGQWHWTSKVDI